MTKKYLEKIFYEMSQAYGIDAEFKDYDKYLDEMKQWIKEKKEAAEFYSYFYDYMKGTDKEEMFKIVEIGNGIYDSVVPSMHERTKHKPIVISKHALTFNKLKEDIEVYNGILTVTSKNEPYVRYKDKAISSDKPNCLPIIRDNIGTFMTTLSSQNQDFLTSKEFLPYLYLALNDNYKSFFIGAYGSKNDLNKEYNLNYLKYLSEFFKNLNTKKVEFAYETEEDSYMASVMVEPDIEKKLFEIKNKSLK